MPPRPRRATLVLIAASLASAACSASPTPSVSAPTGTPLPSPTAVTASATEVTPTRFPSRAPSLPSPSLPSQTETAWGRIWDAVPDTFPLPPGATPTEPNEPVSAAFDVPAAADEVAIGMQGVLELGSYSTESMSGPDESGAYVIDSVGPDSLDCRVQSTVAPLGGLTRLTIRYGAACPFE
jgi:hypothetical protein